MSATKITRLDYSDQELATLDLPSARMRIVRGLGSGLTKGPDGQIYAIGDRGPNLKIELAVERYGLAHLKQAEQPEGAKVMPCLEIGPAICALRVVDDRVDLVQAIPLRTPADSPMSGLPTPGSDHGEMEPALDLSGDVLPNDTAGADTEGIVAMSDGSFWIGDEYGPSLLHVTADGTILKRWVPEGCDAPLSDADYPVHAALPRLAAKRQLNRGFEAIGISRDEAVLYLAFQSPLAHPDVAAHKAGRWIRIWKLDARSGALLAQFAYPLDTPESFRRDCEAGPLDWADLKISEMAVIGDDHLLLLERGSKSTKLCAVRLEERACLDSGHAELDTRPTLEELSAAGDCSVPLLSKQLVLSTDDHPEVSADLEGLVILDARTLLLVNDNDFGIEDAETSFWKVELDDPLF